MNSNDLWAALGELEGEQAAQVLIELFARFEGRCTARPDDEPAQVLPAQVFFRQLASVLDQVGSCNVSRR